MTTEQWKQELKAAQTKASFMGTLAWRYSADEMHQLWQALSAECKKYGNVFVADAIRKDPTDAELALFRYYKRIVRNQPEEEPKQEAVRRSRRMYPVQRGIARKFVALILALLALVLISGVITKLSLEHSDAVIDRADRILMEAEHHD